MAKKIPDTAASVVESKKKLKTESDINFDKFRPAWRIGKFDHSSRWGLKSLLGEFEFRLDDAILEKAIAQNDEELFEALKTLDRKVFASVDEFWKKLAVKYQKAIPSGMLEGIARALVRDGFKMKIYPKLESFESNTWTEILSYTHHRKDKMVSNNHSVPVENLSREARKRLEDLKYNADEIFSLRLEAKVRIYGFRVQNYLEILWVDMNHEIYPVDND